MSTSIVAAPAAKSEVKSVTPPAAVPGAVILVKATDEQVKAYCEAILNGLPFTGFGTKLANVVRTDAQKQQIAAARKAHELSARENKRAMLTMVSGKGHALIGFRHNVAKTRTTLRFLKETPVKAAK